MIDVLYVSANRLEFTRRTLRALMHNTNWWLVRALHLYDDLSADGTAAEVGAWSEQFSYAWPDVQVVTHPGPFGGPVAAMNDYLSSANPAPLLAKVDNDFVMPPDWLDVLAATINRFPHLDILGTEPDFGGFDVCAPGKRDPAAYGYLPARFIGGKGIMRTAAWEGRPMRPGGQNGYFGFTEWQNYYDEVTKGWLTPGLRCFGLDQLPIAHFRELTDGYVERGWQRRWPEYAPGAHGYWSWWTEKLSVEEGVFV